MNKVIYQDENGNTVTEVYNRVELIETIVNGDNEWTYNPNHCGSANLKDVSTSYINTKWAEYRFGIDPWGNIWEQRRGYSRGCVWSNWEITECTSIKEAQEMEY